MVCKDCKGGNMIKASHIRTNQINTKRALELLHIDFMGSFQVESYGGKKYVPVCR